MIKGPPKRASTEPVKLDPGELEDLNKKISARKKKKLKLVVVGEGDAMKPVADASWWDEDVVVKAEKEENPPLFEGKLNKAVAWLISAIEMAPGEKKIGFYIKNLLNSKFPDQLDGLVKGEVKGGETYWTKLQGEANRISMQIGTERLEALFDTFLLQRQLNDKILSTCYGDHVDRPFDGEKEAWCSFLNMILQSTALLDTTIAPLEASMPVIHHHASQVAHFLTNIYHKSCRNTTGESDSTSCRSTTLHVDEAFAV
jgi:hypothetical protein